MLIHLSNLFLRLRQAERGGGGYYVFSMSRCPDVCPVPTSAFSSLSANTERISMKFWEVVTSINTRTDYVMVEIVTETREQDTSENSNRRQTGASE